MLTAGSTVNDIAHHFGCSRQTIHNLMNRHNSTGSVRFRARPGRARATTLRHHRVNMLTHPRNRFNQQPLLIRVQGVCAQKIIYHFLQKNGPGIFQHATQSWNNHTIPCSNNVNDSHWPASSQVMNPIEYIEDELGLRASSNHQMGAINDPNMYLC